MIKKVATMVFLALYCTTVSAAFAETDIRQCISTARKEADSCRQLCATEQELDIIECRTQAKGLCGAACGEAFSSCLDPIQEEADACRDVCATGFEEDRVACATSAGCTLNVNCHQSENFYSCITDARNEQSLCRVRCNRDLGRRQARRDCHRTLRQCLRAC